MNTITGRSAFLTLLKDEGVTHMFGNPGTTELPIMHALSEHTDLTYVLGLQESIVVAMAASQNVVGAVTGGPVALVGGLLVAVVALGLIFYNNGALMEDDGGTTVIKRTLTEDNTGNEGSSFSMNVDDEGVSVSSESDEN